ncbi:MAG: ABC transporter substrate-binding protein [Proteobacteria bacterium]|nr:ABC transporter substrate-binding protein [Pseudomonadota bacterium]
MRKAALGAAVAGALLAPAMRAWAEDVPGVTKDTITIGSFGAMTGPNYLFGKLVMNGAEVVFDQVNAAGGIYGRKLVLLREDDRCEPAAAIAAAKKLIFQDKVFALNGGGCSNASIAARDEVAQANVPWLINASVHDGLTDPPLPTIFTSANTGATESKAEVEFALKAGAKKIALVSMRDAWGRARYDAITAYMKKKGVTLAADEELAPDANDATPVVLRLKQAGADAVIMLLYPKPGAVLLRDSAKFAFKPTFIGQSAIGDPAAFEEQVGVPGATANFVTISHVKYVPESPEVGDWKAAIQAKYPGDRLSTFNLVGIGSAQVLVAALKAAGPDLTREKFLKALAALKIDKPEMYGVIDCTKGDHRCNRAPAWIKKEPGGVTKVIDVTPVE